MIFKVIYDVPHPFYVFTFGKVKIVFKNFSREKREFHFEEKIMTKCYMTYKHKYRCKV